MCSSAIKNLNIPAKQNIRIFKRFKTSEKTGNFSNFYPKAFQTVAIFFLEELLTLNSLLQNVYTCLKITALLQQEESGMTSHMGPRKTTEAQSAYLQIVVGGENTEGF